MAQNTITIPPWLIPALLSAAGGFMGSHQATKVSLARIEEKIVNLKEEDLEIKADILDLRTRMRELEKQSTTKDNPKDTPYASSPYEPPSMEDNMLYAVMPAKDKFKSHSFKIK